MTLEIAAVLSILAVSLVLFITEKLPMDVVALLVLGTLAVSGLVTLGEALAGFSNHRNCYGVIKSGNAAAGYAVEWDDFPHPNKLLKVSRKKLTAISKGEEEAEYDREGERQQTYEEIKAQEKEKEETNPFRVSKNLCAML